MSHDPSKTLAEQADPVYAKEKAEQDPDVAGHKAAVEGLTQRDPAPVSREEVDEAVTAKQAKQTEPPADDNANTDDEPDAGGAPAGVAGLVNQLKKDAE